MDYSKHFSTKTTAQTSPIPLRDDMTRNNAGGFVFTVSDFERLNRFLIIGTDGGTYYANESKLTIENANFVVSLIKVKGIEVVKRIVEVSQKGIAPKNDPAIFALALACSIGDAETKKLAYQNITNVCRTGTHLFLFCQQIQNLRKWSRGLRTGVSKFYESRTPDQIAIQLMKYRQREGWSHRDVIRLAHPNFPKGAQALAYATLGKEKLKEQLTPSWLAFEEIQKTTDVKRIASLVAEHKLPWEVVPTEHLNTKVIWESILPNVGLTALLRNLNRLTKIGMISQHGLDDTTRYVAERFNNKDEIKRSRLHPINILNALKAYSEGEASPKIIATLEDAFYLAFDNVTPTNRRYMLSLDVSGSMSCCNVGKMKLTPREIECAMALVTMKTENESFCMGFSDRFIPIGITKNTGLRDAVEKTMNLPFSTTDCSIPMIWATVNKAPVDVFVIYTDNETYAGKMHPAQALAQYRQVMGINAKLIVVGMTATSFTIADPKDMNQMDVVGFSTDTPQIISSFVCS